MSTWKNGLKELTRRAAGSIGYEIRRKQPKAIKSLTPKLTAYEAALQTLLACRDYVHIVQIGANDGAINDPIYAFVSSAPDRTYILLVEPQEDLIPYLRQNYAFHPNATIFQGAVGPPGTLELHAVDPAYWPALKPIPYATGWPNYRAPTGVTSAERAHVHKWLRNHLKESSNADKAIYTFQAPCMGLVDLLTKTGIEADIDVLQVDAEGFDDVVIYNANIGSLMPTLINFEVGRMEANRQSELEHYLESLGYRINRCGNDALAVRIL